MPSIKEQVGKFTTFLQGSRFPMDGPVFQQAMKFVHLVKAHPDELTDKERIHLRTAVQMSFGLSESDLEIALADSETELGELSIASDSTSSSDSSMEKYRKSEKELWDILPPSGYLRNYCEYTKLHEGPLAYHVFCALAGISAVSNNKVWYDMTYYKLYPALSIILLGPSGVKKSTSAYVIADALQEWNYCETYSEKITPEAFADSMVKNPTGLILASELSSMLGKQKYLEGFIPLLTRLLDHRTFPIETKSQGKRVIVNPAPTFVGCSTPDWMVKNTPEDTFGGGFMARHIVVAQEDSPRVSSSPGRDSEGNFLVDRNNNTLRQSLQKDLGDVLVMHGEMSFTTPAFKRYDQWYRDSKSVWKKPEVALLGTYYQRKADHVKRVAMCIHLASCKDYNICLKCFNTAVNLLDWTEQWLVPVYKEMFKSNAGVDADLVLRIIRSHNGIIDHSKLVRAVQYKMDASRLKVVLTSLKEGRIIEESHTKLQHCYMLLQSQ